MDSGPGTEEDPHLQLTREVIPSLVQQVLQALPRASSSTLTHANAAADPPSPPQSTNSSTEQHPPPPPSELAICVCYYTLVIIISS